MVATYKTYWIIFYLIFNCFLSLNFKLMLFLETEVPVIGGSRRVTLVVVFAFLPQNFRKFKGSTNDILSVCECSSSS